MSRSFFAAALLAASVGHASDFRAAYVDIQRALMEVEEGKAAKARLQKIADQKQKAFEAEQAAIKAEVDSFQKQRAMMDDKARDAKEMELQKKTFEFAQRAEKLRVEIAESERKELATIFPKFEQLLGQIAQREGLTMVFDRSSSGLAWAPPSLDLTNELIRMYNAQYKSSAPAGGEKSDKKK
ncbi:MAG: OmpH family outer membrane protein [Myxococcota bacterium]|jgi:outer membrane protein